MIEQHIAKLGGIKVGAQQTRAVEEADVRRIEEHIGASLPEDYRAFLLRYGAEGAFFSQTVAFSLPSYAGGLCDINEFISALPMKNAYCYGLVAHYDQSREDLPAEVMPIADDGAGNYFCLAVKGEFRGQIYFWNHEEVGEMEETPTFKWLELIAPSFENFLNQFFLHEWS